MIKSSYRDMLGRKVNLNGLPKRIVSVVPSQTELLFDLGLDDEVVGITKFCVHPISWFKVKKKVGGTKKIDIDNVKELKPDLIIANKEENTQRQIQELSAFCPVWVSDIHSVEDALHMIKEVGLLVGKGEQAETLAVSIAEGFYSLVFPSSRKKVAYFIWRKPWMVAGGDTFISNIIKTIGWENALSDMPRYPEIELNLLRDKNIDLILLSSEPYPFKAKHIAEIKAVLPDAEIKLVDGEMFSWYGSRMKEAVGYFKELIG